MIKIYKESRHHLTDLGYRAQESVSDTGLVPHELASRQFFAAMLLSHDFVSPVNSLIDCIYNTLRLMLRSFYLMK